MKTLGRFQLLEELGRGGMGVVYRGHDPQLGRDVAIKVLLDSATPEELARFAREAEATARLRHPGIVAIHGLHNAGGRPFIVMDLAPGRALDGVLKERGPLPPQEAVELTLQLARALDYAHGQGVVHRDVKPANVLLDAAGQARLTDLGLAHVVGRDTRLTLTGDIMGTPVYMPPEQANGRRELIGPHSDVYALGATLYLMLTGEPPFKGTSLVALLSEVFSKRPVEPIRLRPELDPALSSICMRCLAKDPEDRYVTAAALVEDLEALSARSSTAPSAAPWPLAVAALALLIGLAIGSASLVGDDPPPPPVEPPVVAPPDPGPTVRKGLFLQPGPLLGEDTYVRGDGYYLNDNFGCHTVIGVGVRKVALKGGGTATHPLIAYLKFDLGRLPPDARIEQAELVLHVQGWDFSQSHLELRSEGVHAGWVEGTSTVDEHLDGMAYAADLVHPSPRVRGDKSWFNHPDGRSPPVLQRVSPTAKVVTFDVTAIAQARRAGRRLGIRLSPIPPRQSEPGSPGSAVFFFSSDSPVAESRPKLVVSYTGSALEPRRNERDLSTPVRSAAAAMIEAGLPPDLNERQAMISEAIQAAPLDLGLWVLRSNTHALLGPSGDKEEWTRAHLAIIIGCGLHRDKDWTADAFRARVTSGMRCQELFRISDAVDTLGKCRDRHPELFLTLRDDALRILDQPNQPLDRRPHLAELRRRVNALSD